MITMFEKNIKKEHANAGSFHIDRWEYWFKNVVIYSHSSKWNNIIFTPLMNYVNQSYYKDHPIFHLTTENETRTYQIFGVINVDLNNLDDSLEFTQSNWNSNNAFNASISDSINRELYKTGVNVDSEANNNDFSGLCYKR